MPALNFQTRFAPLVKSGLKGSTIRAFRRDGRHPKQGDILYLYTGMRTKQCELLKVDTAKRVSQIRIIPRLERIYVGSERLTGGALTGLFLNEGFGSFGDMMSWFQTTHGDSFFGNLIEWLPIDTRRIISHDSQASQ